MRDCIEGLSKIDKHDSRQTIINNTFLNIVKNINYSFLQKSRGKENLSRISRVLKFSFIRNKKLLFLR